MTKIIPSCRAMLCWNPETKKIGVMEHPAINNEFRKQGYTMDVGASMPRFRQLMPQIQAMALIAEGISLIRKDGFDPETVFSTLEQIDDCNAALNEDPFNPFHQRRNFY